MSTKPLIRCNKPGCRGLVDRTTSVCTHCGPKRRTDRHDPQRGTRTQRGYGADWQRLRKAKLAADPLCESCEKRGKVEAATEVHHIIPFEGITDPRRLEWRNLESSCRSCHASETGRASEEKWEGDPYTDW